MAVAETPLFGHLIAGGLLLHGHNPGCRASQIGTATAEDRIRRCGPASSWQRGIRCGFEGRAGYASLLTLFDDVFDVVEAAGVFILVTGTE